MLIERLRAEGKDMTKDKVLMMALAAMRPIAAIDLTTNSVPRDFGLYVLRLRVAIDAAESALAAPAAEPAEVYNPWRESLENCISGDNYLSAQEYRDLIDELDDLYRMRAAPASKPEYLLARGAFGLDDSAIDAAMGKMILLLILFVLLAWSALLMLMIISTVKIAIALAGGVACGLVILLIMWLARFQADREERDRSGRRANER